MVALLLFFLKLVKEDVNILSHRAGSCVIGEKKLEAGVKEGFIKSSFCYNDRIMKDRMTFKHLSLFFLSLAHKGNN